METRIRVSSTRWMSSIKDARTEDDLANYQLSFFDEPVDPVTTLSYEQAAYFRHLMDRRDIL